MPVILYALGMVIMDVFIMILLKLKSLLILNNFLILPVTMIIYSMQPLLFYTALSSQGMAIINSMWNAISTVIIALIGFLVFSEKISVRNWIGIALCASGILLIGID
jgi:multidrug transporter EmrE-like cation transporter